MPDEELAAFIDDAARAERPDHAGFIRQIHRKRRLAAERELRRREQG
jgi:hypothetical protein